MKAKLIKTVTDNYILVDATKEFHGEGYLLGTTTVSDAPRLSLKNCQAIELGYDLDELAMGYDLYENINFVGQTRAYKAGFQKALEILGDKKFSEVDVLKVVTHVLNELVLVDGFDKQYLFPESIYQETTTKCKSLQQTEWDVEIEMECVIGCQNLIFNGENSMCCGDKKPKLDADGNLILKRK